MATLTVQKIVRTGITPSFAAADVLGDKVANDGQTFVELKNTNGANRTPTFASQIAAGAIPPGAVKQDVAVIIPLTSGDKMIGPWPTSYFNDPTGFLTWTYDAVTNLTVGCFTIAP
jgi:hypothetical protein